MSYTPPSNDSVDLSGSSGYNTPSNDSVDLSPLALTTAVSESVAITGAASVPTVSEVAGSAPAPPTAAVELTGLVGDADLEQPATGDADLAQPAAGDADLAQPAAGDADLTQPTAGDRDNSEDA